LSEPLQTPPAVDTAGTSRPAAVPLPPKKKAQATRPAKPKATRAAVRRKPAATQTSANTTPNPFSALFGAPAQ
jgi:hypothetical protein